MISYVSSYEHMLLSISFHFPHDVSIARHRLRVRSRWMKSDPVFTTLEGLDPGSTTVECGD